MASGLIQAPTAKRRLTKQKTLQIEEEEEEEEEEEKEQVTPVYVKPVYHSNFEVRVSKVRGRRS